MLVFARLSAILAAVFCLPALGQSSPSQLPSAAHTPSGVQLSGLVGGTGLTLRVDALRDDVLRVRVFPAGKPAEDASWAVLPASRTARIHVVPNDLGFTTGKLRVIVSPELRVTVMDLDGNILSEDAAPIRWDADGFRVAKSKPFNDHFFGLGDKPGPLDRNGEAFAMWNTDAFGWQESTDPIYKSIPFFLEMHGGRTIGVLFDNTFRTFFDFGRERTDRYSFSAPAGPCDYYLLYGPEPKQVVETYAWLTGPTPLPPLWSLGYQQSRYSYYPQKEVEDIAAHLRADKIPTDVIWLDIDYQDHNRPFTVDTSRFPDFPGMIHKLSTEGFHTVAIVDLHVADLPNAGYLPYDSGKAGDHFVKENGQDYVGPVWPGPSVFPDFTQTATRQWYGTLFKKFTDMGVAGFWNDMNEPAIFRYPTKTMPDDVVHRITGEQAEGFADRTAMHPEIHNVFGMENSRATHDGVLALRPNLRPFVMTRASYAGGQRYSATWTGDNLATWNHLHQTIPQLVNLGLSGFALSGADFGFGSSPTMNLLTRWFMLAAFQPIDRDHMAKGTQPHEPWIGGPEHEAIRRRFTEERYRLMPYLYTTAEEMSRTGLPIDRPLFLEFPHATRDEHPLDNDAVGEFMFGSSILVADNPRPEDPSPYDVQFPPAVWYDYWTGQQLDRRGNIDAADHEIRDAKAAQLAPVRVTPKLDVLPVYVRAGTILPIAPLVQSTSETPQGPLTLRVFAPVPGGPCSGSVYTDDGLSFDFQHGQFARESFTCTVAADGALTVNIAAREGKFKPWWSELRIEAVGSQAATTSAGTLEVTTLGKAVTVRDNGKAQTITLR